MVIGKKGKKSKGKKISLQEFVHQPGGTGVTQVQITKLSWAEECVDDDDDKPIGKIIELPTAPRAARLLQDDCVPANAPFVAYLSNLPYDVEDSEIERFFDTLNVVNIRLPRDDGDSGKSRGYGYVEFEAREDLIDALSIPDPMINGRRIKIDLTSDNDGQGRGNRRNNRYGNDSYNSGDRNTNWRDRQDGGFSGGRDNYEGGRRNNNYGNRRDRDPVSVDASEAGSWRTGDRPKYSPPAERKQYDRPGRPDRDRFGGRRRNDFQGPPGEEDLPSERPKLNLKPRTLPMPELSFPKEEEIPVIFKGKPNGDVEHPPKSLSVEQDDIDGSNEEHEDIDDIHEEHNGEDIERPEKISSPKPRGVPSAKVFGDAKPVDTAAKEREIEEKLAQRERDQKLKTDDEKKRLAEVNENENVKEEELNKTEDENRENPVREIPRSIEPVKSWRDKDGDDGRPRNKNYSPERDSRGPPRDRRHDNKLKDRNFRDNRPNDRFGNRNNRNYNQRRGDYRSDRGGGNDTRGGGHHHNDRDQGLHRGGDRDQGLHRGGDRDRRDYNREPKDVEERMPKFKPAEGANFSVSNTFADLDIEDAEE